MYYVYSNPDMFLQLFQETKSLPELVPLFPETLFAFITYVLFAESKQNRPFPVTTPLFPS